MVVNKELRVRIEVDSDVSNPRDEDCNFGTMVCWHKRYMLGDKKPDYEPYEFCWRLMQEREWNIQNKDIPEYGYIEDRHIAAYIDKHFCVLPLFLYDHGGITMSTGRFSCPWDSGQVGYIYVSLEECQANWMVPDAGWKHPLQDHEGNSLTMYEYAERLLKGEVETYDNYLTGDVYGFIIEQRETVENDIDDDPEWEEVDSCWGFYGTDWFSNGMSDYVPAELHDQLRNAEIEYPRSCNV